MTGLHTQPEDATPLTPEEREGLIPGHVALRAELNEIEQQNILKADRWAFQRRRIILTERFALALHRRMFGEVWRWAGQYRRSDKNIGVPSAQVQMELVAQLQDAQGWIDMQSYERDEIAVRLHHRLVLVHPFPNGNGRWSRLMADVLVTQLGGERFSWGSSDMREAGVVRQAYIDALRRADRHEIAPLLAFARS